MKLIGSLMEKSFRDELSKSWVDIKKPGNKLFPVLENGIGSIRSAFVLSFTPEQDEDICTILINGSVVVMLEIVRSSGELVSWQEIDIKDYKKQSRSRQQQVQLLVALDLASSEENEMPSCP